MKKTESMGYDVAQLYEELIFSETKFWSAREGVDKLVAKQSTCGLWLLWVFNIAFVIEKGKGWVILKKLWTCLEGFLTSIFRDFLGTYSIKLVFILLNLEGFWSF